MNDRMGLRSLGEPWFLIHVTSSQVISHFLIAQDTFFDTDGADPLPQNVSLGKSPRFAHPFESISQLPAVPTVQAMTNSDFRSALTSGFHTESSKSRSREPSLDMLLLLLLRPAFRLGSHW